MNRERSSPASSGFILPPSIRRIWRRRSASSYMPFSRSVSGISSGTLRGAAVVVKRHKGEVGLVAQVLILGVHIFSIHPQVHLHTCGERRASA